MYELDAKNEWENPRMWIKANPGIDFINASVDLARGWEHIFITDST